MDDKREMLRHFLAAIAYRTQKALRDAPESFASFRVAPRVRTPHELVWHMDSVLGYARTFLIGGQYRMPMLPSFIDEIERLHTTMSNLSRHFADAAEFNEITPERMLQGPLADAMTHAGQLAMLRRLFGAPIPPENFVFADVNPDNTSSDQALPVAPDQSWPDAPDA